MMLSNATFFDFNAKNRSAPSGLSIDSLIERSAPLTKINLKTLGVSWGYHYEV